MGSRDRGREGGRAYHLVGEVELGAVVGLVSQLTEGHVVVGGVTAGREGGREGGRGE
jgi:hypothetical protein